MSRDLPQGSSEVTGLKVRGQGGGRDRTAVGGGRADGKGKGGID